MPDDVMLTEEELVALAGMAATLDDPWLARQLVGTAGPAPPEDEAGTFSVFVPFVAMALVLVGLPVALAGYTMSSWMVAFGSAAIIMGMGLLWREQSRRWARSGLCSGYDDSR